MVNVNNIFLEITLLFINGWIQNYQFHINNLHKQSISHFHRQKQGNSWSVFIYIKYILEKKINELIFYI